MKRYRPMRQYSPEDEPPKPSIVVGVPEITSVDISGVSIRLRARPNKLKFSVAMHQPGGIMLTYEIEGVGIGTINSEPYGSFKEAEKERDYWIVHLTNGNVTIEYTPRNGVCELKLNENK